MVSTDKIYRFWAEKDLWLSGFDLSWTSAVLQAAEKVANGYWPELKVGHVADGRLKIDLLVTKSGTFISE